jgi:tripartite ATP-independent transporter DctP family solute receptor
MKHLLSVIALAGSVCWGAYGQTIELKLAHIGGPGSLFDICAQEYARRVNEQLGGRLKIAVYGGSQLGSDKEALAKVKNGEITFTLVSTVMSSVADEFGVFELPFLVHDRDHIKRFRPIVFKEFLEPAARDKGYFLLAMWENGFRHITSNVRPVETPKDLQGLRLRVPESEWRAKMFRSYGASPAQIVFDKVLGALESNVVDAQENPLAQIYGAKFYLAQKYLTLTNHVYTPAYLLGNPEELAKLPPEASREMEDWVLMRAAQLDQELLLKLQPFMKTNEADPLTFTLLSLPAYQDYASTFPKGRLLIKVIFQAAPIAISKIDSGELQKTAN